MATRDKKKQPSGNTRSPLGTGDAKLSANPLGISAPVAADPFAADPLASEAPFASSGQGPDSLPLASPVQHGVAEPASGAPTPLLNAKEQATADSLRELSRLMEAARKEYDRAGLRGDPLAPFPAPLSSAPFPAERPAPLPASLLSAPLPELRRIEFSKVRQYPWHQCTAAFAVLEEGFPAEGKEEIRRLRANLWDLQEREARPFQLIGVTTVDNPACTWLLAASLAGAHASSAGARVLLIDADLEEPLLQEKCSIPLSPGLRELTSGECTISDALRRIEGTQLYFMTAGKLQENRLDPLDFRALRAWIPEMRSHFDWVFLRMPTCERSADVVALEPAADAMLLVVERGQSGFREVGECLRLLQPDKLLGTVLT